MQNKRVSPARTILTLLAAAAGLSMMSGCATIVLSDLTPKSLPENPSEIYTFTLRVKTNASTIDRASVAPRIVVDGQTYPMKKSALGEDLYEFEYQLPPGRQEVAYYYLVNYQVTSNGKESLAEAYTGVAHSQVIRRNVLEIETSRGPVGSRIGVLGRGFTPQDVVAFNATPVRTVFASPTSLDFFVPALPAGQAYQVTVSGPAGTSPVGTFRIDGTNVTVSPSSLTLRSGEQQTLTFTLSSPSPAGGLLLDVTTDIPSSVIMPEIVVPAGQVSVSVPVAGGRPGAGSLVLKGYAGGGDVTIPITVSAK
jgi:hypothetical protein